MSEVRAWLCPGRWEEGRVWAHSVNVHGRRHRLEDHLRGSAVLAREFGDGFGLGGLAWWAALTHDGGKAWCQWQVKLLAVEEARAKVGLDHRSYGVHLAHEHGLEPVMFAVAGHHGGLTNWSTVEDLIGDDDQEAEKRNGCWADAEATLRTLVPELYEAVPSLPADMTGTADRMTREFLVRFLFSCLVDADALDTHAHFQGLDRPHRGEDLDGTRLLERFLHRRTEFL